MAHIDIPFLDVLDANGDAQSIPTLDSRRGYPVHLGHSGNIGMRTAGVWMRRFSYTVPSGYVYRPLHAYASVTTAGSDSMIVVGRRMGTWAPSSNTFTAYETFAAPFFGSKILGIVAAPGLSAAATTVTLTYTDQDGSSHQTRDLDTNAGVTGGTTFAASAPAGNAYEFIFAADDHGVRAVTGASDTANPTGQIDIWGVTPLMRALGVANAQESVNYTGSYEVQAGDTIMLFMQAAATTAQIRAAGLHGFLLPV